MKTKTAKHTPGLWRPIQQTNGTWLIERTNPDSPVGLETMRDKRGGLVFRTESEARDAIAKAEGRAS